MVFSYTVFITVYTHTCCDPHCFHKSALVYIYMYVFVTVYVDVYMYTHTYTHAFVCMGWVVSSPLVASRGI